MLQAQHMEPLDHPKRSTDVALERKNSMTALGMAQLLALGSGVAVPELWTPVDSH